MTDKESSIRSKLVHVNLFWAILFIEIIKPETLRTPRITKPTRPWMAAVSEINGACTIFIQIKNIADANIINADNFSSILNLNFLFSIFF